MILKNEKEKMNLFRSINNYGDQFNSFKDFNNKMLKKIKNIPNAKSDNENQMNM